MKRQTVRATIDTQPCIATWELWTVAQMLVSTHGANAEAHCQAKLADAVATGNEAEELVWSGVITQLRRLQNAPQASS